MDHGKKLGTIELGCNQMWSWILRRKNHVTGEEPNVELGFYRELWKNLELEATRCGIIGELRCGAVIILGTRKEHGTGEGTRCGTWFLLEHLERSCIESGFHGDQTFRKLRKNIGRNWRKSLIELGRNLSGTRKDNGSRVVNDIGRTQKKPWNLCFFLDLERSRECLHCDETFRELRKNIGRNWRKSL